MHYRAICYDVGTFFVPGKSSRPVFDADRAKREIGVIKYDLHCNAIRIFGHDLDRLLTATDLALDEGLCVWLSPMMVDATPTETLEYFAQCASRAEARRSGDNVVFIAGCELSLFMKGIFKGDDIHHRIKSFVSFRGLLRHALTGGRWPGARLNQFLNRAITVIRERFQGPVSYASGTWERVDWRPFDFVGVNYYRDAQNAKMYQRNLQKYLRHGKPMLVTEFGCCTYEGADAKGAYGWMVLDGSGPRTKIKGGARRSEETQARYLAELLELFARHPIEGACVFNFASDTLPCDDDPQFDLDMASYAIVKTLPEAKRQEDVFPWEPKAAFHTVAEHYARLGLASGCPIL